MKTIIDYAKKRHATKAFTPGKTIPQATIEQLKTLIRYSPSSVNSQPWHFVIAGSEEAKQRFAKATHGPYASNALKITQASHVIAFCAKTNIDNDYLLKLLENEKADGRFDSQQAQDAMHKGRSFYVNKHLYDLKDAQHWMEKQIYLALGTALIGAATLDIDAVPIEGFDTNVFDAEFSLREQGYSSVVLLALGYHSESDFNANLPKSRWPEEKIFSEF